MAIAIQESVKNLITTGDSFLLPSWTPQANELVLVQVSMRGQSIVPSLSGNGLTFVEITRKDDVQGVGRVIVFRAMSASPSTGQITVTVTGNTKPVAAIAIRVSGADTSGTNGSGAIEATATAEVGSVDNNDLKVDITTLTNGARAIAVSYARLADITLPSGEVAIDINYSAGSGGDNVRASAWYEDTPTAGTITLGADNDLSSAREWAVIAVGIKPASGTIYSETLDMPINASLAINDAQNYLEILAMGASQAWAPADIQEYIEELSLDIEQPWEAADRQNYLDTLAMEISQEWEEADIQEYIEALSLDIEQPWEVADRQNYLDTLAMEISQEWEEADFQEYLETLTLDLQQSWEILDEISSAISEVLDMLITQSWGAEDRQEYVEMLALDLQQSWEASDLQSYLENVELLLGQVWEILDGQSYREDLDLLLEQAWEVLDLLREFLPPSAFKTFYSQAARRFESLAERGFYSSAGRRFESEANRKFLSKRKRRHEA